MFLSTSARSSGLPDTARQTNVAGRAHFKYWIVRAACDIVVPALIYTGCFFILTYPWLRHWSTDFYCDDGDGLQNEWNLWWIRKAILELHQSPWFTTWLHAPMGTTLIGHTLNPFNGFVGIPLSFFLTPFEVYNVIVAGSFVFSGVTAFWLARHVCGVYVPALLGGFAFTFTGYHIAHAWGHMQLISMEFIPLFLLAWLRMLERPGYWRAIAAASALGLLALCDFYYVLYCVLSGALCWLFYLSHLSEIARQYRHGRRSLELRFIFFAFCCLVCCGPLVIALLAHNARDPFIGAHNSVDYSADIFSAFLPGGANLLGRFTKRYWIGLTGNISDQCVYVGLTVCTGAIYGYVKNRRRQREAGCWAMLGVCSYVLSLGPVLHIAGFEVTQHVMAYALLERLLPPLQLGGCPSRITVMLALSMCVLLSLGITEFCRNRSRIISAIATLGFAIIMAVDLWPSPLPTVEPIHPAWTTVLRNLPRKGAILSNVGENCFPLYYQTLYDRPAAFGYISRIPNSVYQRDQQIAALAREHQFAALSKLGFVYVVLPREEPVANLPIVYRDDQVNIEELPRVGMKG